MDISKVTPTLMFAKQLLGVGVQCAGCPTSSRSNVSCSRSRTRALDPKLPAPLRKDDVQCGSERPARHLAQVRATAGLERQVNEPSVIGFLGDC